MKKGNIKLASLIGLNRTSLVPSRTVLTLRRTALILTLATAFLSSTLICNASSANSATTAPNDMPFSALTQAQRQQLRFIVLAPHLVESMYEIGAGQQIIGTTDHADYPKEANAIPRVGNYARLQIERILQLKPDAVIAWKTGNPIEDLERLKKYGIAVIESHPQQLDDVAAELRLLGKLTGRENMAEATASNFLLNLNKLREKYSNAQPISVFYELWSRPLRTVAGNAWPQQQVALCGAVNPFATANEDYPQVNLEEALATKPQLIIQPSKHSQSGPDALNWQQWTDIPAVKNNFIVHPNADKVHRMTTRMLEEVIMLCEQIHQARQFYQTPQNGT